MKNYILISLLSIGVFQISSAQISDSAVKRMEEQYDLKINSYLHKSKQQKTWAWILTGGGMALSLIGSSVDNNGNGNTPWDILSDVGGASEIAGITMFFISSKSKNNAHLAYYQKQIALATSDSLRKMYANEAADYFETKARSNKVTGIVLSAAGAALIIGGVAAFNRSTDTWEGFWNGALVAPMMIASGTTLALVSIPFYVRGANLKRKSELILKTERVSLPAFGLSNFISHRSIFPALAVRISLD